MRGIALLVALGIAGAESAPAQSAETSGAVTASMRAFPRDPFFPEQEDDTQWALSFESETAWQANGLRFRLAPYLRLDSIDDHRNRADLREAYVLWRSGAWEGSLGADTIFWGVTESRHLVNIVNQIDALDDVNEESFLGQPMARLSYRAGQAQWTAIVMSGLRERRFPSAEGRLRGALVVDEDAAQYEDDAEQWAPDLALRYALSTGALDLGVTAFHGTAREPSLVANAGDDALLPLYDRISQASVDLQWTREALAWKAEALVREGQGETFGAFVGGLEWTLPGVIGLGDLGLLAEYLYDGRDETAPFTPFDDDVFIGARFTFNDVQDTAILAGGTLDLGGGAQSFRLEVERRFGDVWTGEGVVQVFANAPAASIEAQFRRDSFIAVELARHF